MKTKSSFMYDDFSDRLLISNKTDKDVIKGSVRILNLILDFNTENKIINIELRKASDYLNSIKIDPIVLKNLKNAEIVFKQCRDGILFYFVLTTKQDVIRVPYNIRSSRPLTVN